MFFGRDAVKPLKSKAILIEINAPKCYIPGFCNLNSYLLIFPFKFTWNASTCSFILTSSKLRKILCAILHVLAVLGTTPYLVGFFYHLYQGWTQPSYILTSVVNIVCYLTTWDFLHIIWKKRELILDAANWHCKMKLNYQVPLYKMGFICLSPLTTLALDNPLGRMTNDIVGIPSKDGFSLNASVFKSDDNFLHSCYFMLNISFLYGHLYYLVSTGFLLALTLSIKESVAQLANSKASDNPTSDMALFQGIRIEAEIRNLFKITNSIIDKKVLLEYVMMVSFYATIFEVFQWDYEGSNYHRSHVLFYLFFSGTFWIHACEVHCLVRNYVKDWVQWYRANFLLDSPETLKQYQTCLLAVQTETDLSPACISCRCFNVTYGFIGSMFGLIITYSTIVYQMKSSSDTLNLKYG